MTDYSYGIPYGCVQCEHLVYCFSQNKRNYNKGCKKNKGHLEDDEATKLFKERREDRLKTGELP